MDSVHRLKMRQINMDKQRAMDSLTVISSQRLFTIEELRNKQSQANEKIRYIVRDYRSDELDSLIRVMFSDIKRLN